MGRTVQFCVPGRPSRWQRAGQHMLPSGTVLRFTDPVAAAGKKKIAHEAKRAFGLIRPSTGPVLLRVIGIFAIPESWPEAVKREARAAQLWHIADPDLDQIVKQVQDALVGIAYVDDNQVCGYPNSAKRYGHPERTEITVQTLDQIATTPGQRRLEAKVGQLGWDEVLNPPERRRTPRRGG